MSMVFSGSKIMATRAFEILGMLATMAAIVCGPLKMFVMKKNYMLQKLSGGLNIVAGAYFTVKSIFISIFCFD